MAILPDIGAAEFQPGAPIDNPFFPLELGSIRSYAGSRVDPDTGEVETERNDLFATFEKHEVFGVETTVIRDTVYANGVLAEETLDWYAQDTAGNLWYFGEIVINFEYDDAGNFIGTNNDGAWEAGVDGARPGHAMPAEPGFGPAFYLEHALGVAEDESIVVGLDEAVTIDKGSFEGVLKVLDSSALHPDGAEFKFYAPGVGEIAEQALNRDGTTDITTELQGQQQAGGGALPGDLSQPALEQFQGDGSTQFVTYLGGDTGSDSAIGAYQIDVETGALDEGRILFSSTADLEPGASIELQVDASKALGLFIVANPGELGLDLSKFENGGLFFDNMLTGERATIGDGLATLVADGEGNALPIQAFHALGGQDSANFLNPAAGAHAVDLGQPTNDQTAEVLGFEDTRVTDPTWDGDFNDVLVGVGSAPLTPELAGADALLV
jgi:hypothetical protein